MKSKLRFRNYHPHRRNRWRQLILALLLGSCAMTVGCATKPVVRTDFCTGWRAIYPSRQDVLTDGTAKQILAHDQHGVDMGCWKAPTRKSAKPDSVAPAQTRH